MSVQFPKAAVVKIPRVKTEIKTNAGLAIANLEMVIKAASKSQIVDSLNDDGKMLKRNYYYSNAT